MSTSGKDASSFVRASSTVIRSTASGAWRASKPPLPGLAEVGGAMKALIGSMKAGGSESEECTLLMERIENLLGVAQDFDDSRHPELADMLGGPQMTVDSRQLCELKDKFETESKRQSGILGAERRQSMLDRLACKVGGIVEATSLRIQLRQAEEGSNPIDNFPMVGAHEITEQTILYKGTRGLEHALEHVARFGRLGESVCDSPVTSVTRHPNFATVIGITKGYSGLNGYVVTAGEIPVHQFISTVDRGAPLVKFVRGILEVKGLDLKDALGVSSTRGHITVQPNGHLTIFPVLDNENDSRSVDLRRPIASEAFNAVMNPATRLAVDVYLRPFRTGTMSPVHKFLDSVAALGWETFTPLEVARLAAECEVTPAESWQPLGGSSGAMPLLFLNDGNIEHSRACDFLGVRWEPIEAGQAAPSMTTLLQGGGAH
ncbi:hypothetical protein FRC10_000480 [Ceratobasidium sp. 414]|nr:hypothetical protein FRC10_000480 [Ceratobasidium sp. 414]